MRGGARHSVRAGLGSGGVRRHPRSDAPFPAVTDASPTLDLDVRYFPVLVFLFSPVPLIRICFGFRISSFRLGRPLPIFLSKSFCSHLFACSVPGNELLPSFC